jgi:hypothetical protein
MRAQVDLQYPPAKERPARGAAQPLSFRPGQAPSKGGAARLAWPEGSDGSRPSFADLLAGSLRREADMRAWFDAKLSYQHVRQTRAPKRLPRVLVVSTALADAEDLIWWQPYAAPKAPLRRTAAWLPPAVSIDARWQQSEVLCLFPMHFPFAFSGSCT